jgi:hypothetical protein
VQPGLLNPSREARYPFLSAENYTVTSDATDEYNCVAWAAGVSDPGQWWPEPEAPEYYWPPGARRDNTLEAFAEGFGTLGYEVCESAALETGFEKIAVYALHGDSPQHVARQLRSGEWTSKLGGCEDIQHSRLEDLAGGMYGRPALIMRRPATN